MTEKLTLKKLSDELETLHARIRELEQQLEQKLETSLEKAVEKLKTRIESHKAPEHGTSVDTEYRQRLIAEEAYLIAERRGFQGGDSAQDWAMAEKLVNHRLMEKAAPAKATTPAKSPAAKKARSNTSSLAK
jgi:phosphoglycerate-specific signal transduction histidine kinase